MTVISDGVGVDMHNTKDVFRMTVPLKIGAVADVKDQLHLSVHEGKSDGRHRQQEIDRERRLDNLRCVLRLRVLGLRLRAVCQLCLVQER